MCKKILQLQLHSRKKILASDLSEQVFSALTENGYDVETAFLTGESDCLCGDNDRSVKCFNFHRKYLKGFLRLYVAVRVFLYCRRNGFDLVIAHRFKPINILMLVNRFLNIPCIGVVHGFGDYDRKSRRRRFSKLLSVKWKFIAVSRPVMDYLVDLQCGFDKGNTLFINNAVEVERLEASFLDRNIARRELGFNDQDVILGSIGRLVPVKGYKYLIDAFSLVCNKFPNAKVAIIGGGRDEQMLREKVADLGLEERFLLLGWKDEAARYLKAFDAFILPSLSEGLPIALLEAMSAKLPVIGSDIETVKPVVDEVGRVFKCCDVDDLARALVEQFHQCSESNTLQGIKTYDKLCCEYSEKEFKRAYLSAVSDMVEC